MQTKEEIETGLSQLVEEYGEYVFDIPLPHGLWTRGGRGLPHTRLKRVMQIAGDVSLKPLSECRVLDLGCLDGIFSVEFALRGAQITGVEIRDANLKKAEFVKEAHGLDNLRFVKDDVRDVSRSKYGSFDIVVCSGILYHLNTPGVFTLVENMAEMAERLVIIDTHISLKPSATARHGGRTYHGHFNREHAETDSREVKEKRLLASIDNNQSFWLTRPSLVNILGHVGFSSVYECFNPPHLNFGRPGLECVDRCTFLAVKGRRCELLTSPAANRLEEDWPEGSLSYGYIVGEESSFSNIRRLTRRMISRHVRRIIPKGRRN